MAVLTAVVTALALGLAINFLLTLGVLRRLRLRGETSSHRAVDDLPTVGEPLPPLNVETVDGHPVDASFFEQGPVIVGFFVHGCPSCDRAKERLQREPIGERLLALVRASDPPLPEDEVVAQTLAATGAFVAMYSMHSDLMKRMSVSAFPTFMRVERGVVTAASTRLHDVLAQRLSRRRWNSGRRAAAKSGLAG